VLLAISCFMANEIYLKGKIVNGKIIPDSAEMSSEFLAPFHDREVVITIGYYYRKRTEAQNRWYWGVAITKYIIPFLLENEGVEYTREEIHAYHLTKVAKVECKFKEISGNHIMVFENVSTRNMTTKQFKQFAAEVQEHWRSKTNGELIIPDPNQTNFINDDIFG